MKSTNGSYVMPKKEFKTEHKRLVGVLRKGGPAARAKEASYQENELAGEDDSPAEEAKESPAFEKKERKGVTAGIQAKALFGRK